MRRAPKNGYLFGQKAQYRRNVWSFAARYLKGQRTTAQVLLMPSLEGKEIDVAKSKGFLEKNMHVVDNNPAIVATLKKRYPHINTYGVDLIRALDRIADKGIELSFANFDLCSHIEGSQKTLLDIGCKRAGFAPSNMVFISLLRGREGHLNSLISTHQLIERVTDVQFACGLDSLADNARAFAALNLLKGLTSDLQPVWANQMFEPRTYKSGTQSMMYIPILRHAEGECECEFCIQPRIKPDIAKLRLELSKEVA